jgi:alkanesulfonate monooxygenase SsuD/methylene tetrahydromethanopterin reductase-like flavin-dependent oxidoreductase (luciferase family)
MHYGFVLPGGTPRQQVEAAVAAEAAGWHGVFVPELNYGPDAWTLLTAMSEATSTLRIGTMLTPLAWRRPWKLASQITTLDQLSDGRVILAIGMGAPDVTLGDYGGAEVLDRRERAALLDDGIAMLDALWSGRLSYEGTRHRLDVSGRPALATDFVPVQKPRVPIWVVGAWPRDKSMARVVKCDGLLPIVLPDTGGYRMAEADDLRAMVEWLDANGGRRPGFDVVMEGETSPDDEAALSRVAALADAGATWWLESRWMVPDDQDPVAVVTTRIAAGPPSSPF